MNRLQVVLLVLVALIVVAVLAVSVSRVGGVAIRSASRSHMIGSLETANKMLLPGVPVTVSVTAGSVSSEMVSVLLLRLPTASLVLREVSPRELLLGSFTVDLPCDSGLVAQSGDAQARLVLVDNTSQAVLAQSDSLTLLPPGPDCILRK